MATQATSFTSAATLENLAEDGNYMIIIMMIEMTIIRRILIKKI